MESKSKFRIMESYQISPKGNGQYPIRISRLAAKKENTPDIISKSFNQNNVNQMFNLNFLIMGIIRNNVQLIGNVGQEPTVTNLENGKKVARFSLATNVFFKNSKGEKQKETNWHNIVAWGKTAEIVEKYTTKGKEIAVLGKLKTRSFSTDDGIQRVVTEVEAREILLMGSK